jgi:glucose/arabinose dehydrogenase
MKTLLKAALLVLVPCTAHAQVNAGTLKPEPELPFTMTQVATFNRPWRIAFLPDGRMVITEKVGPVWLVTPQGEKTQIANAPAVLYQGQGGMLGVFTSPKYATDHYIYLTYSEPGDEAGTSGLALARAELTIGEGTASFDGLTVLWRDMPKGRGGQFGAQIAFSPDGQYLFLTVGDRQRMTPAQDPNTEVGKLLRLTPDGKPAAGNPMAGQTGATSRPLINPPRDTEVASRAGDRYTLCAEPALAGHGPPVIGRRAGWPLLPTAGCGTRTWSAGDELNLIEPGRTTAPWSRRDQLQRRPIGPRARDGGQAGHLLDARDRARQPSSEGAMFPVAGLGAYQRHRHADAQPLTFDGKGGATPGERWNVGKRLRDVEVAPDGALWMLEDSATGGLFRVTPK